MKQTLSTRATILVNSCDSYEDVWDSFFFLMNKYWDDCPFEIIINTESKKYDGEKWPNLSIRTLNLYKQGYKVPYGKRVRDHCRHITTEYIITLMDDFFIRSKVLTDTIFRIVDWMDRDKKIGCVCLVHHNDKHNVKYKYQEEKLDGYSLRPRYCNFAHDMQACIWRRNDYIKSWKDFESPWQWESISNIRSFDDGIEYYDKDCYTPFAIDYIDYKKNEWSGIRKGKWVKETVYELFMNNGIDVDFEKRGFYHDENDICKRDNYTKRIKDIVSNIRCCGPKRAVPYMMFSFRRIFRQRVLKKNYYENYCEYLRHKYYDKC